MKCNSCGAEISDEARFCEKCGAPVGSGAEPRSVDGEAIPAPKPLEQPLSAGAVPFVPMAPAPRAMPRSMRAPRPYEPRPGFSPAQPGTSKPKRAASLADLAEQIPPAPDPKLPREQREDEAELAADQKTWEKYPAANAASGIASCEVDARDARRREREEEQRRRKEAKERRAQARREERERREAERAAAAAERAAAEEAERLAAEKTPGPGAAAEPAGAPADPDATTQLRVPVTQGSGGAAAGKTGASRRAIAAIAALVVIAIVGVVAVGAMNRPAQGPSDAPAQSEPKGGSGEAGSDPTDSGSDAQDSVPVRSAVEDYSWDELSELSAQIAAADSDSVALEIAKKHNLCLESGKLDGSQTKKLQLSNGKTVTMRIVGFRQDERADGSGKAGVTMISEDAVASRHVSQAGTYSGWEGSELRTWMNDDLLAEFPDEVSSKVVEVSKKTVGFGATSASSVDDKLWIPSFSEVVGKLTAGMKRSDSYVPEGDQYQLFFDEDVQWGGTYSILGTQGSDSYWWLRSIDPLNTQYYLCVSEAGEPWYSHLPATEHAILMGFCL